MKYHPEDTLFPFRSYYPKKPVKFIRKRHKGVFRIFIDFKPSKRLDFVIRNHRSCTWSRTHGMWYVPDTDDELEALFAAFQPHAWIDTQGMTSAKALAEMAQLKERPIKVLNDRAKHEVERFADFLYGKDYSENTIKTYINILEVFFGFYVDRDPTNIDNDDVTYFLHEFAHARNYSTTYKRQMISALKLFYRNRLKSALELEALPTIASPRKLPKVLAKSDIERLLQVTNNLKHRCALSVMYGCGLRVSEVLNIRPQDIDSKRGILFIRNSKGKKDRVVQLSERLIALLRKYYKRHRPSHFLFEGYGGKPYSSSSLAKILKRSAARAGIKQNVSCHMLRHSYATHLLESGVDLRYIQELLGHKSSRTTEIYTYVSTEKMTSISSPIDDLDVFGEPRSIYNRNSSTSKSLDITQAGEQLD